MKNAYNLDTEQYSAQENEAASHCTEKIQTISKMLTIWTWSSVLQRTIKLHPTVLKKTRHFAECLWFGHGVAFGRWVICIVTTVSNPTYSAITHLDKTTLVQVTPNLAIIAMTIIPQKVLCVQLSKNRRISIGLWPLTMCPSKKLTRPYIRNSVQHAQSLCRSI